MNGSCAATFDWTCVCSVSLPFDWKRSHWKPSPRKPVDGKLVVWKFGWETLRSESMHDPGSVQSGTNLTVAAAEAVSAVDKVDIALAVTGDSDAYGRLVARHQQAIARYVWRFSRDATDHEELVQTVFIEAYFQLRNFAGRSPWSHWLQVIATRVGYRYWKAQSRQRRRGLLSLGSIPDLPSLPTTPDALEVSEQASRVHAVLERLPPRDRLVVTLLHLEERSIAEISQLTGWSQTMVKVQAFRARGKLARLLAET